MLSGPARGRRPQVVKGQQATQGHAQRLKPLAGSVASVDDDPGAQHLVSERAQAQHGTHQAGARAGDVVDRSEAAALRGGCVQHARHTVLLGLGAQHPHGEQSPLSEGRLAHGGRQRGAGGDLTGHVIDIRGQGAHDVGRDARQRGRIAEDAVSVEVVGQRRAVSPLCLGEGARADDGGHQVVRGRRHRAVFAVRVRWIQRSAVSAVSCGAVTVLVSHRFSTVHMTDHIAVVDNGRLVEHGNHQELLAANGLYAELYRAQAQAYA